MSGKPINDEPITVNSLETPIGWLSIVDNGAAITAVHWTAAPMAGERSPTPLGLEALGQLAAYFSGRLRRFDVPTDPTGTPFQKRVWHAIAAIPFGQTSDYTDIARAIDSGPRAVGGACGRNPIPIIIPCHRVLARTGLGGYSGTGGLVTKTTLLEFERRMFAVGNGAPVQ